MANSPSLLLVDDDQELLQLLAKDLQKAGFQTVQSPGVGDAKLKLANQTFDCIVMDLQIGSQTGLELAQSLRAGKSNTSQNKDTPIVLMSGYLSTDVVQKIAPLVQGIMAKPFDSTELIEKINELLGIGPKVAKEGENFFPSVSDEAKNKEFRVFLHDFSSKLMVVNLLVRQLKNPEAQVPQVAAKLEENLQKIEAMIQMVRFSLKNDE